MFLGSDIGKGYIMKSITFECITYSAGFVALQKDLLNLIGLISSMYVLYMSCSVLENCTVNVQVVLDLQ